ncbi:MAG: Translation elongation factor Ts [uncultured Rubrobacteraceae bacterium]|uniref:Elongation factor Ts n=1 Tax=uncultured Rubrobacteraceae bacterium TaxID=349277 RepID=A0A6J4R2A9_9ACTN|nr:MAG: Translation elongation factor Ts [uncultured Rubrobacteraceae bacterium]
MASTIEKIKQLREETAAGMMDVKRALEESSGDLDGARRVLRERGQAIAAKKSSRDTHEGLIESYIHFNGKLGVMLEVNCETDFVARTPEFKEFARNIALHVASMNPLAVSESDVPAEAVEEERSIARKQAQDSGKPENIQEKIVEGRVNKFVKERALLSQEFVKEPGKTVNDLLQDAIQRLGENIVVRRFVRYEL